MSEELVGALVIVAILFIVGALLIINRARKTKKQEKQEREARAKRKKELDEMFKIEDAKIDLYINSHNEALKYLKDKSAADWILDNIVNQIIEDLGKESLLTAHKNLHVTDNIVLGPYTLNRAQFKEWNEKYLKYKATLDASMEKSKQKAKQKQERQHQTWQKYVAKFKALNYAQQENELEWFKKKVAPKLTQDKELQDKLVHQLEITHLGSKRKT